MSVIRIQPTLRQETGGEREVLAVGETVRDLLDDLTARFPGLREQLDYANVYVRSEEHTSELQSRYVISYAVFCLKKKKYDLGRKTDSGSCERGDSQRLSCSVIVVLCLTA